MCDNTTLKIKFKENLSDNSVKMIKEILKNSLGFETEISEVKNDLAFKHKSEKGVNDKW